jgi:hypothetical protein
MQHPFMLDIRMFHCPVPLTCKALKATLNDSSTASQCQRRCLVSGLVIDNNNIIAPLNGLNTSFNVSSFIPG